MARLTREARQVLADTGLCACGCGTPTKVANVNTTTTRIGEHYRWAAGHNRRDYSRDYLVDAETGCWVWQLACISTGYGSVKRDGHWVAHRWYYTRLRGAIPEGLELDHLCRNRKCVNPDHLEPVTRHENIRRGAATKLTWADVEHIRSSDEGAGDLAVRLGVTRTQIYTIRKGDQWQL